MTAMGEISTTTARQAYDATLVSLVAASCLYGLATAALEPAVAVALRVIGAPGLATVAGLALASVVLVTSSRLGPMWVTAPERLWRVPASLLQERSRTMRLGSAIVAVLMGVGTAAAVPGAVPARAAWGLGAAAVVVLALAGAAAGQRRDRSSTVSAGGILLGIASVSVALTCTASDVLPFVVVAVGTIVALIARNGSSTRARPATRWRPAPPLWELRRSGAVVDALRMATVMLDGTPLAAVADAQLAPRRRHLAVPAPVRPLLRILTTSRVIDLVPLLAVPAAVVPVGGRQAGVLSVLVLTYVFSLAVTRLLDVWVGSPAIARTFATSRPPLGPVLAMTGLALTSAYALVGCALAGLGTTWAGVATSVAALAWARRLSGCRLGARVGALMSTPLGAVPLDLAQRVVAGIDVLVLSLVALPPLAPGVALAVSAAAAAAYLAAMTARGR
jgi:hypothetical protein